jgi:hypothetical protein
MTIGDAPGRSVFWYIALDLRIVAGLFSQLFSRQGVSMGAGSFQLKVSGDQMRVEVFGILDVQPATRLEAELGTALAAGPAGSLNLVVNTTSLSDCAFDARPALVKMQRRVAGLVRRTAWMDDRPKFRGLALWVMHEAGDPNARATANAEQAKQWLAESVDRVTSARNLAEVAL